jgi:amino acid transporter
MTEEENYNGYPKCNLTINGNEYYDNKLVESTGKAVGSIFAFPFVLMSAFCTFILSIIFIIVGYKSHKKSDKYTSWVVIAYIIGICCLSSFVSNLVQLYKIKHNLNMVPENPDRRPCISSSDYKTVIV